MAKKYKKTPWRNNIKTLKKYGIDWFFLKIAVFCRRNFFCILCITVITTPQCCASPLTNDYSVVHQHSGSYIDSKFIQSYLINLTVNTGKGRSHTVGV